MTYEVYAKRTRNGETTKVTISCLGCLVIVAVGVAVITAVVKLTWMAL